MEQKGKRKNINEKGNKKTKKIIDLKNVVKFFNENLKKKTSTLFIIFALISVIFLIPIINEIKEIESGANLEVSLWSFIKDKLFFLVITVVAGLVPYMYIAVLGGIGYVYQALVEYAYIIIDKGYFFGILIIIIPLVLNLICISLMSSLGMYLCKINTHKFKLTGQRNMNFDRFRLEFARVTGNKEKEDKITKKIEKKESKIQSKETKIRYKEVFTILGIACVIQIISSLIEGLFI